MNGPAGDGRGDGIPLPARVTELLNTLHRAGQQAYVVGGCVRDSLLGRQPGDWDICTDATPDRTKAIFSGCRQILTGEKHGTVALVLDGAVYEITTYRVEGGYSDGRHPDGVRFVPDLRADLARRDFTVNAMAYSPEGGLVDLFGGQADLAARQIRCVGDPAARFGEDALRILRAVRFAAQLDFTLDEATARAAASLRRTLDRISAERCFTELDKLLAGPAAGRVLSRYGEILAGAVPEILPCIGCDQPGRWHCYDVWQHTAVAVGALDLRGIEPRGAQMLRWAVFLHDLAKPCCRSVGADGAVHFYGHNQRGAKLAREILRRLKAPANLIQGASSLVAIHDAPLPEGEPAILRALGRYGAPFLRRLCRLKYADLDAHARNEAVLARRRDVEAFEEQMTRLAETGCYTVGMLQVNGGDVMERGVRPGPMVGQVLNRLLQAVIDGELPNEREALLEALDRQRRK